MADVPSSLKALSWGVTFLVAGTGVGAVLDRVMSRALIGVDSRPLKALAQFSLGVVVLGQIIRTLVPADAISPVGDVPLLFFFYIAQPQMLGHISWSIFSALDKTLPYHLPEHNISAK